MYKIYIYIYIVYISIYDGLAANKLFPPGQFIHLFPGSKSGDIGALSHVGVF